MDKLSHNDLPVKTSILNDCLWNKGALLYVVSPVSALCETEQPGHLSVRAVYGTAFRARDYILDANMAIFLRQKA